MMLTRKAANEKREHALTFTFELAGCLNLARVRLVLRQSRQFCGNGCSRHPAPIIHGGFHVPIPRRVLPSAPGPIRKSAAPLSTAWPPTGGCSSRRWPALIMPAERDRSGWYLRPSAHRSGAAM